MDDRCDHCGQRAFTWWWRADDKAELCFCAHCTKASEKPLRESRFVLMRDRRSELTPA